MSTNAFHIALKHGDKAYACGRSDGFWLGVAICMLGLFLLACIGTIIWAGVQS